MYGKLDFTYLDILSFIDADKAILIDQSGAWLSCLWFGLLMIKLDALMSGCVSSLGFPFRIECLLVLCV